MTCEATIVGAGIGGLTTAIGLRDAGWEVTVLERWPEVVGIGAALGLWPQAQDALAALGLGDAFAAASVPTGEAGIYRSDGRRLLRMPADSPRIPDVRLVSRRSLMDLLVERATGIEIRTGVDVDDAHLRSLDTDVIIGADGVRSGVRATFFGDATAPRFSGLMGWRGFVEYETGGYGETWGPDGRGGGMLFGLTPMAPGRTNFYAAFDAAADAPGTLDDLRDRFIGWRDPIPAVLDAAKPDDVLHNPIYDLAPPLRSFVTERVALLGDAAHAMTPHAGRGACEAILDAASLVRSLTGTRDVAAALRDYDTDRRRSAQKIAARSWRMRGIAHATGAKAGLRNTTVRTVGRFV